MKEKILRLYKRVGILWILFFLVKGLVSLGLFLGLGKWITGLF